MSLKFARIRGKDGPKVEAEMQAWLTETPVAELEDITVHRDTSNYTVYSVFYWEAES